MGALSFLFKDEKLEYEKRIKELEEKLENKEKEISNLILELDKASKITPKQIQIFEKNINDSREKVIRYKKLLTSYGLDAEKDFYRYKIDINEFYPKKKFPAVAEKFIENGIFYIDDLNEIRLSSLLEGMGNSEEIRSKFSDYKVGKFDWEIATLKNKGDKLTKVYAKLRKLLNVFAVLSLEYIDDIRDFDFNSLKLYSFNSAQIEDYKSRRDDYYRERRIIEDQ